MSQSPPIALIEANAGDVQLFRMALNVLNVAAPLASFERIADCAAFLASNDTLPGLIVCSLDTLRSDGPDARGKLPPNVPLVLFAKRIDEIEIGMAFRQPVQGLFFKEASFDKYLDQLDRILKYWSIAITPHTGLPPQRWR